MQLIDKESIRNLQPAYFALVMATGIVAIACDLVEQFHRIAQALAAVNAAMFLALLSLNAVRLARFPREVLEDLLSHARAPGFLTLAAGSAIFGGELLTLADFYRIALALWCFAILCWGCFTYAIFTIFTVKATKPPLDRGINGGWLLAVVSTQAVAQLALLLIPEAPRSAADALVFTGLALWLWGGMLYIWMISLIFYRYTFFSFAPSDLMPPYWINMGAMAISTLVGALLSERIAQSGLAELRPFVEGFTIFFWATATWWIPMLLILGFWRHAIKRFPISYDPLYWGAVFPLGVYSVATHRLSEIWNQPFFHAMSRVFFYIAAAAWLATFIGMARSILRPAANPNNAGAISSGSKTASGTQNSSAM